MAFEISVFTLFVVVCCSRYHQVKAAQRAQLGETRFPPQYSRNLSKTKDGAKRSPAVNLISLTCLLIEVLLTCTPLLGTVAGRRDLPELGGPAVETVLLLLRHQLQRPLVTEQVAVHLQRGPLVPGLLGSDINIHVLCKVSTGLDIHTAGQQLRRTSMLVRNALVSSSFLVSGVGNVCCCCLGSKVSSSMSKFPSSLGKFSSFLGNFESETFLSLLIRVIICCVDLKLLSSFEVEFCNAVSDTNDAVC